VKFRIWRYGHVIYKENYEFPLKETKMKTVNNDYFGDQGTSGEMK
jgi:hypothetical protein